MLMIVLFPHASIWNCQVMEALGQQGNWQNSNLDSQQRRNTDFVSNFPPQLWSLVEDGEYAS